MCTEQEIIIIAICNKILKIVLFLCISENTCKLKMTLLTVAQQNWMIHRNDHEQADLFSLIQFFVVVLQCFLLFSGVAGRIRLQSNANLSFDTHRFLYSHSPIFIIQEYKTTQSNLSSYEPTTPHTHTNSLEGLSPIFFLFTTWRILFIISFYIH